MFFNNLELQDLAKRLNKEESLPEKAFRRDVAVNELVSSLNSMIACCVSENDKPLKVLITRVHVYLEDNSGVTDNAEYYALVKLFIECLEAQLELRM